MYSYKLIYLAAQQQNPVTPTYMSNGISDIVGYRTFANRFNNFFFFFLTVCRQSRDSSLSSTWLVQLGSAVCPSGVAWKPRVVLLLDNIFVHVSICCYLFSSEMARTQWRECGRYRRPSPLPSSDPLWAQRLSTLNTEVNRPHSRAAPFWMLHSRDIFLLSFQTTLVRWQRDYY